MMNMKNSRPHGMRNAALVALFLLVGGTLTYLSIEENVSRAKNRASLGSGSYGLSRRLVKIPVFACLPTRFLNREAVPISRERNASVLKSVYEVFDPSLKSFLTSVPIVLDSSADTAKAYRTKYYIGVSPDWDNTVLQSKYRTIYEQRGMKPEDPVFMHRFKTDLLIHEFLHILQLQQGMDARLCYEAVSQWYINPRYGIPSPNGMIHVAMVKGSRRDTHTINRMKYIVWHELYNSRRLNDVPKDESWKNMQYWKRYRWAEKGVEEFAYIGQEILSSGSSSESYIKTGQWTDKDWGNKRTRLLEVSPEVIAVFRGVFNPKLTQQQKPDRAIDG
jgi:hypothetical protein